MLEGLALQSLASMAWICLPRAYATTLLSSPIAETEIICAIDNPSDCYPRLFQPTERFQPIKEGQDIPSGLHVRLDIYTGEREARLNIPMGVDEFEGTTLIESAAVLVDSIRQDAAEPNIPEQMYPAPNSMETSTEYHDGDNIQLPNENELYIFRNALKAIRTYDLDFISALDDLAELSHGIYYGQEVAKEHLVLETLVCLLTGSGTSVPEIELVYRQHKAAIILFAAFQNNPAALKVMPWMTIADPDCGPVRAGHKKNFVARLRESITRPNITKSEIAAIDGFLKHDKLKQQLLGQGIMEHLLETFVLRDEVVKKRVASSSWIIPSTRKWVRSWTFGRPDQWLKMLFVPRREGCQIMSVGSIMLKI